MNVEYLILSDSKDYTTDYVAIELHNRKLKYLRLDRDLLDNYKINFDLNRLELNVKIDDFSYVISKKLKGVFYRAPTYLRETFNSATSPNEQIKNSQWMAFFRNLELFSNAKWINSPSKTFLAENKLYQLKIAKSIGFKIPNTLVSNNVNFVSNKFSKTKLIVKSLDTVVLSFGNTEEGFFYTNDTSLHELEECNLSLAPIILQNKLEEKIDIRVTVVGKWANAVSILRKGTLIGVSDDWRKEKNSVKFENVKLPRTILAKCIRIVSELGLVYGAIDLIYSKGEYYFIEINPTGEWAWLVHSCGQDTQLAICNELVCE